MSSPTSALFLKQGQTSHSACRVGKGLTEEAQNETLDGHSTGAFWLLDQGKAETGNHSNSCE